MGESQPPNRTTGDNQSQGQTRFVVIVDLLALSLNMQAFRELCMSDKGFP